MAGAGQVILGRPVIFRTGPRLEGGLKSAHTSGRTQPRAANESASIWRSSVVGRGRMLRPIVPARDAT